MLMLIINVCTNCNIKILQKDHGSSYQCAQSAVFS